MPQNARYTTLSDEVKYSHAKLIQAGDTVIASPIEKSANEPDVEPEDAGRTTDSEETTANKDPRAEPSVDEGEDEAVNGKSVVDAKDHAKEKTKIKVNIRLGR